MLPYIAYMDPMGIDNTMKHDHNEVCLTNEVVLTMKTHTHIYVYIYTNDGQN